MKKLSVLYQILAMLIVSNLFISCNEEEDDAPLAIVRYSITISPDLLKFASPFVTYVDENGIIHTISGEDDLNEMSVEFYQKVKTEKGWTKQTIYETKYKRWTLEMHFNRLNFHTFMKVEYRPRDFTEDTKENVYFFSHAINTLLSVPNNTASSSSSALPETDNQIFTFVVNPIPAPCRGDEVQVYLDSLKAAPDKVGFFIDENGNVHEEYDF